MKRPVFLHTESDIRFMIQRIQSLFLVIVAILTGILPFFFNLWINVDGTEVFANNELLISIAFYASAVLAIWSMVQ